MLSIAAKRVSRFLTIILSATLLAGCFGEGDGPTPIAGTPAPPPPVIPPGFCDPIFNFEDACGGVSFNNFEGGDAAIIDNPDMSGINTSEKVARMLKFPVAGGGTFGGTAMLLTSGVDFSAGEAFTMKVWASRSVPVLFKFEGLNQERSLDHSGSGTWEELCYDFTGATGGPAATDITVIFDINVMGASDTDPDNWTFYFDEIVQVESCDGGGGGTPISLPVTFDDATVDYELTDFGGAATALIADPDNAANTVASSNKPPGAELFAGTTVGEVSGFGALPFTATDTSMTVRVYSPDAGIPVRLKVEDRTDNTISVETEATTTVANAWETLTFDFSVEVAGTAALNLANTYDKASIFFNFGTDGNTAGDKTYLWEDLAFVTGGGGGATAPTTAAPPPTQDSGSVISLFANGYANVSIDAWPTPWSSVGSVQDVTIEGNTTKEHIGVNFVGIETTSSLVDASGMTHLHVDLWTPDATEIRLKLVDFGADMAFGGGDDSEHELTFDTSGSQGQWISLDIPLADFTGLTSRTNLAQYIISATPPGASTIYLDNLYFYDETAVGGSAPTAAPPAPTQNSSNVVSLLSAAFSDVTVDTWRTDWSSADLSDVTIDGQAVKQYTNLDFVGIETVANQVDATGMTHFHVDVWTPNAEQLRIKLVDFGANGVFDGGDDTEGELIFDSTSTPALAQGQWLSLDIPLTEFETAGLTSRANIAQFIFSASPPGTVTLFVTNMYFYDDAGGGAAPTVAAPTPVQDAGNVVSLFSDAYTDVTVDTWRTDWSDAAFADITVAGNATKEYTALNFVGIETVANQVDASGMTHFRVDFWTPDITELRVKLVDFGADGAFGGGDDTEHELIFDGASTPALVQGQWVSLDIPLTDFTGLTNTSNIAQYIFAATPVGTSTLYIDNLYFYNSAGGGGSAPTVAAPTPSQDAANVVSLFSDAYADAPVDTWRTVWSDATFADVTIAGNATKEYTALNFVGIETVANQVDASGMTHFRVDFWTPDISELRVKLVDFGADGAFGGGDDTEHELLFDTTGQQGQWVSLDILLTDFTGLTNTSNIAQYIFAATPVGTSTLYIDNLYFYNAGGGSSGAFVNGDFETGDFTGWVLTQVPDAVGSIAIDNSGQGGRTGSVARLIAAATATQSNDVLISQVALAAGTVATGDAINVSFDLYGSLSGAGGVVFVEVIFLDASGQDVGGRDFVGPAAPYVPTAAWTNHSGTVVAGTATGGGQFDVSGGVTLQLKVACGPVDGCGVDASFDNVTFTIN